MANRAVRQLLDLDVILLNELAAQREPAVRRGLPVHDEDLVLGPQIAARDCGGTRGTIPWSAASPSRPAASGRPGRGTRRSRPPSGRGSRGGSRRSRAGRGPAVQASGSWFFRLARTGSSIGLSDQICEWQVMQVCVGGMPANATVSTDVWQYRQSIPRPLTWCSCVNGTGWSRITRTCVW